MTTSEQFSHPDILLEAYRQRARRYIASTRSYKVAKGIILAITRFYCRLTELASSRYQDGIQSRMDNLTAWNHSSVDWTVAATVCNLHSCLLFIG